MPVEVPKRLGPVPQRLGADLLKQAIRSRAILQHQLRELDTSPPAAARSSNDEVRGNSALGDRRVAIRASPLEVGTEAVAVQALGQEFCPSG